MSDVEVRKSEEICGIVKWEVTDLTVHVNPGQVGKH